MKKVVTVVQARTGSSRLPNKIMMDILGKPLLIRMAERVQASLKKGLVIVATTTDNQDDIVEKLCKDYRLPCFRGDALDLLDRHYQAAKSVGAEIVVKIPSDCPLIDPKVIDQVLSYFLESDFDYVSNLHPATYPDGNDVEAMTFEALEKAWKSAKRPLEREHTTPYIWENADQFKIGNVTWETGLDYSMTHRWTIDYPEDFTFIKTVYENLYPLKHDFGLEDVINLTRDHPEIFALNSKYAGVNWYRNHLDELKTIKDSQTKKI